MHTKKFLEGILKDVCQASDVSLDALVTDTARTRLVMASGGVPRDYLNLVRTALAQATRREGEVNRPKNKVTAEDVTVAAPEFLKQKEDDLRVDAQPKDVERLRRRLGDVLNFCLNHRQVNVFMVESRYLREEQWGQDIAALADLRFFHRIGIPTVKSSETMYVGKRYEAFAIDLSSYASTRVRTKEIDFWTGDGFQRLRAVSHVYTPETVRKLEDGAKSKGPAKNESQRAPNPLYDDQITLFDAIQQAEAEAADDSSAHDG